VGALLGPPGRKRRAGWVRSRAWIWDFSSTHTTTARSGGSGYNPTTSRTLASSCGSVENLKLLACQGFSSCCCHTRATVLRLTPSSAASSRLDQCVTPSSAGGGARVAARISEWRARRTVWGRPGRGRQSGRQDPHGRSGAARRSPSVGRCPAARRSQCWRRPRPPAAGSWPAGPAQPALGGTANWPRAASSSGATVRAAAVRTAQAARSTGPARHSTPTTRLRKVAMTWGRRPCGPGRRPRRR
jgi:hypothetical protein